MYSMNRMGSSYHAMR
uniref:Uncharacterized protein n=1 Tax=Rhizophora mucronata TaxID=61149 RepID=A0A2P2PBI0_RHIMU